MFILLDPVPVSWMSTSGSMVTSGLAIARYGVLLRDGAENESRSNGEATARTEKQMLAILSVIAG